MQDNVEPRKPKTPAGKKPQARSNKDDSVLSRLGFMASFGLLCLVSGVVLAWMDGDVYRKWFRDPLDAANAVFIDLFKERPQFGEADAWVYKEYRPLQGRGTFLPEKVQDGITLVFGMQEAWLVNLDGRILHRWAVDYDTLKGEGIIPRSYPSTYVYWHFAKVLPNGDLLVMVDQFDKSPSGLAMMRIDRDSKVQWVFGHHAHHDFDTDDAGNIYVVDQGISDVERPGLKLEKPYLDDGIVILNPDGSRKDRFSLMDAFAASPESASFFNGRESFVFKGGDYLHTNNIDYVEAGTLGLRNDGVLLSFNGINAMATVDLTTRKVDQVWGAHWYRLHSPEMLPNGNILVFDNTGRLHPKSEARVLEFNPVNHGIEWQYPNAPGQSLFSTYRGRVQHLDNGNVLISEFENGRLLEVTRAGETVWEYSCPFVSTENPDYVCNFIGGYRYPTDAFSFPFNQPNENQPNEGARPHTVPVASAGG